MNDLRMYVEQLFRGRVLTDEMIELKEEIYGNLVARYEDYIAGGMDEAEALEKTKASVPSIDDMLAGDADVTRVVGATAESASTGAGQTMGAPVPPPGFGAGDGDAADTGAATASAATAKKKLSGGKIAAIVVAAIAVVALLGWAVVGAIVPQQSNRDYGAASIATEGEDLVFDDGEGSSLTIGPDGIDATDDEGNSVEAGADGTLRVQSGNDEIYLDADGTLRIDGDVADELLTAVVNDSYADVEPYVGTSLSDTEAVEAFVRSLPMGKWASEVGQGNRAGVLSYSYDGVPNTYDGDSVDAAIVYDATAIMCAMPDVSEIHLRVHESDDHARERDRFIITRSDLEGLYGTSLTSDLVNKSGWVKLKTDNLYKHDFIDRAIEMSEVDD